MRPPEPWPLQLRSACLSLWMAQPSAGNASGLNDGAAAMLVWSPAQWTEALAAAHPLASEIAREGVELWAAPDASLRWTGAAVA